MTMDFLIYKNDLNNEEKLEEIKDLKEIHILRGRYLHYMSIIERIIKEYCELKDSTKTFGQIKPCFICKLKQYSLDKAEGYDKFIEALEFISPDRNSWAHGFIFYEKRKGCKPNNSINLNDAITSLSNPDYFEKVNTNFLIIINWMLKNNLFEIKEYNILKFQEFIDSEIINIKKATP